MCELDGECEPTNNDPRMIAPTKNSLDDGFLPHRNDVMGNRGTPPEIGGSPCS